jgi:glycosyltransferase involved in cell wall biosynthesis
MSAEASKKLIIAGPDEGELDKIRPFIKGNIEYVGAVYGEKKRELLNCAHYYILPSFSEGFPSSVLEAMSAGAIPLISTGCNFQKVFENKLGYRIEPSPEMITPVLDLLKNRSFDQELSTRCRRFVQQNYSEEAIGNKLAYLYMSFFSRKVMN